MALLFPLTGVSSGKSILSCRIWQQPGGRAASPFRGAMQRLLWIGSPFFCQSLRSCGWQDVALHNFEDARVFCWEELVRLAGFIPDVLVVADKSRPPFVLGMERFPC